MCKHVWIPLSEILISLLSGIEISLLHKRCPEFSRIILIEKFVLKFLYTIKNLPDTMQTNPSLFWLRIYGHHAQGT